MNKLIKLTFLFTIIGFFVSCGNEEGEVESVTVTSLTVSSNMESVFLEENGTFSFSAMANGSTNFTSQATFYLNGTPLTGSSFTPSSYGEYEVYAKYGDVQSSTLTVTCTSGVTSINVESSKRYLATADTTTFTVKDNYDSDVTEMAQISVNGTVVTGNTYQAMALGDYTVTATYNNPHTDDVITTTTEGSTTFSVVQSFDRKAIIEDYTGAWCQFCPRMVSAIKAVQQNTNKAIPIAIHNQDNLAYEFESQMRATFQVTGFPAGRLNRTANWNESVTQVQESLTELTMAKIDLEANRAGNNLSIDVDVTYSMPLEDTRLVVVITEDGLLTSQSNAYNGDSSSEWYQQGNPITNFVNDHTLRKAFTDIFGDAVASSQISNLSYSKTFNVAIPGNISNINNCHIVAFLVDGDRNAINGDSVEL